MREREVGMKRRKALKQNPLLKKGLRGTQTNAGCSKKEKALHDGRNLREETNDPDVRIGEDG